MVREVALTTQRPSARRGLRLLAPLVLVMGGCNGDGRGPAGIDATPLGPTTVEEATPTVAVPPDLVATTSTRATEPPGPVATAPADDLAAATAIAPLEGFTEVPAGSGIGPLDTVAASAGDPRERDALTRFHFRDGHARGFVKGGEEIVVTVLRFSSPADAAAYLQDTVDSSLVSNGSFLFTVAVPGATGYREQGAGQDGEPYVTYGALFARGDRCFEQLVRSPATGPERSEADAQFLARRQADRVGG